MKNNTPKLRFKDFTDEWQEKKLGDLLTLNLREIDKPINPYLAIGIRSHFKGTFQKPYSDPSKIDMDKLFIVRTGDLVVNITFAWEGAVAIVKNEDDGGLVSHRFPTYGFQKDSCVGHFFRYLYPTEHFKYDLGLASPGGAGRNRVLSKKDFLKIKLTVPHIEEQEKIADFLTSVDEKINLLEEKKKGFLKYKKGVMQAIFSQKIRFKDEKGNIFPDWEEKKLGEIVFVTLPPTKLQSKEFNSFGKYPIIDQSQDFIAGYTDDRFNLVPKGEYIIFGDHTECIKFADFEFAQGADGIKILQVIEDGIVTKYLYYAFSTSYNQELNYKRHWSTAKDTIIQLPSREEQEKIAEFLTSLDNKVDLINKGLGQAKLFKKSLLQQMFV